jgi:hypothetical protein
MNVHMYRVLMRDIVPAHGVRYSFNATFPLKNSAQMESRNAPFNQSLGLIMARAKWRVVNNRQEAVNHAEICYISTRAICSGAESAMAMLKSST